MMPPGFLLGDVFDGWQLVNRKRKVWEFLVNVRSYLDKQMLIRWMNRWNKILFYPSSTMEKAEIIP